MSKPFLASVILATFFFAFISFAQQPATNAGQLAQQQPAPAQGGSQLPPTVLKVKTRMVVVDVVARNGKGAVISDLKPEDFTVLEDGKPQKVSSFSFQHPGPNSKPAQMPLLPANTVNNLPHSQPNGALNVLLLDALNTTSINQAYARESMINVLKKLPPGEPMAVYLLGNKLVLLQDFTSDPELLKQAALSIKGQPSRLLNNPAGTSPSAPPMGTVAAATIASVPGLAAQLSQFEAEQAVAKNDFRVAYTLTALNSLARTLAGYPGRKNLIWISETFPFDILFNSVGGKSGELERHYGDDIAMTGSLLSDAQVAVYPVDPRGMSNNSVYSVGSDPNPTSGSNLTDTTLRGGMGTSMNADSDTRIAAHSTMNDLAEKTGGKAFYDRNDLDNAVLESINDGSSYYTLGYYPDNKDWNSRFRNIRVKVNRSGVKLHYRAGYFAVDRQAVAKANPKRQEDELDQAMTLDWPISTGLPFQAQVTPPSAQTQNKVLIRYAIDPRAMNFESDDKGLEKVDLMCAVRAYSVKDLDKPVKSEGHKMAGSLRPEAYTKIMSGFFPCEERVELPPGKYYLRVGVRDNSTGMIGTANATVDVADIGAQPGKADDKKP